MKQAILRKRLYGKDAKNSIKIKDQRHAVQDTIQAKTDEYKNWKSYATAQTRCATYNLLHKSVVLSDEQASYMRH